MALCKAVTSRSFEGSLILGPVQLASPLVHLDWRVQVSLSVAKDGPSEAEAGEG